MSRDSQVALYRRIGRELATSAVKKLKCRFCGKSIPQIERGMLCVRCFRRHNARMAAEMGTAVLATFGCAYATRTPFSEPCSTPDECSIQPHYVRDFAKWAWRYAICALDGVE
jgi:hypothetical protein